MQAAPSSLPEGCPPWEVEIHKVDIRLRLAGQCRLNRFAVVASGQNPDLREARNASHPIPTYAGLGPLARLARIRRGQHS